MERLRDYRALVAIIDTGGFTAAAERLGMPRSTVSTLIAGLEERLGARLLQRTTRSVSPTEEGLRLAERARGLIEEASSIEAMFRDGDAAAGKVRLSAPGRMAHHLILPALPDFLAAHPDLLIDLRISDEPLDLVSEGLDLVLRVGLLEDSNLICRRLGELPFVNCASSTYIERHGRPDELRDLGTHVAISYGQPSADGTVAISFGSREQSIRASLIIDSTEGYIEAALQGLGIVSLPRFDVQHHLSAGRLIEILPQHAPSGADIALLYPSRQYLPRRICVMRDWLVDLVNLSVM